MKKTIAMVAGALMISSSAFGLETLTDNSLKEVTGQAGVSIAIDDVVIYQKVGETKYTDTDGWGVASEGAQMYDGVVAGDDTTYKPASVVISDKESLKQFNAILDGSKYGTDIELKSGRTFGSYGAGIVVDGETTSTTTTDYIIGTDITDQASFIALIDENSDGAISETEATDAGLTVDTTVTGYDDEDVQYNGCTGTYTDTTTTTTTVDAESLIANAFDGSTLNQILGNNNTTGISPLTIDVGKCHALTTGYAYNSGSAYADVAIAGVIIGLPTLEIVTSGDSYTVSVEMEGSINGSTANPSGEVCKFIEIEKSDSVMAILGGRIEIAAH